ncbi:hypothetical protein MKQ68_08860 [Chitinophaga horti]|uniref:Uncharacterized protein n=1 Tax=Chitinophaga horti TaxID=2920382 RepID=A0ABY6JA70_9BACT|nr:hypothetical protein [Chitinophaga horti]UYQ95204.1 hypothetical protein MKQ68_08860 [Chitinophaga horti]
MLKKIFLLLALCIACLQTVNAQDAGYVDVLDYYANGTPQHGVKIKTNITFQNGSVMPTIMIEGYNYGTGAPIQLTLTFYIYSNAFVNSSISSAGAYTPQCTSQTREVK